MAHSARHLLIRFLLLAHYASLVHVLASPLGNALGTLPYSPYNETHYVPDHDQWNHFLPRQGSKPLLRIMPLGASITQGVNSNPQNGYRKNLRDELRFLGYPVNMVGCQSTGNFKDQQHEGHPGYVIQGVTSALDCSIGQKPNLVLINAGTNDCLQGDSRGGLPFVTGTYDRMKSLVDKLFSQIDGTTIILSTLLVNGNTQANSYVSVANNGYRRLVREYAAQGKKIALAEMNNGFITLADIGSDGTHPTNFGYTKLAAVWAATFNSVQKQGWITEPQEIDGPDDLGNSCDPTPENVKGPTQTQKGGQPEYQDGLYSHSQNLIANVSEELFITKEGIAPIIKQFHFAQLVNINGAEPGEETDEIIRVLDPDQRNINPNAPQPAMSYRLNSGGRLSGNWIPIDVGMDCLNRGVRWGDVDGDGLDDFICLSYPDGDMSVSINLGGSPPTFRNIGNIRPNSGGYVQEDIRLGDIDGDGRLDFCHMSDGNIFCFRNGGTGLAPTAEFGGYWQGMVGNGFTFDSKSMPGTAGVRLLDVNGDFRADWVYVYPDGHTRIFINHRGTKSDGAGLKPSWVEAADAHPVLSSGLDLDHIKFGRLFGTGRQDMIWVKEKFDKIDDDLVHQYFFEAYQNTGGGGKRLRGDGARYCDMFGRGNDDFLFVYGDGTGKVDLFENTGTANSWKIHNTILTTNKQRKSLHFADWNGDGLCDVIAVDKHTGDADVWINNYKSGQTVPTFTYRSRLITGSKCTQGWGNGVFDIGARFADIDGDGRADYLCMEPNGRTTAWLNTASGTVNAGQVKFSEKYDRANHHWADVNGDGRADFVWVDKFTGDVKIWLNEGRTPVSGSSFSWVLRPNAWHDGVDRGANIQFVKMTKSGRADMVQELPASGVAYTYYNQCAGSGSGKGPGPDDGPIVDPNLPDVPGGGDGGVICPRATKCGQFPDLPHFVAMGDSYSAGIGAGKYWADNSAWDGGQRCFQYTNAYPYQLFYQEPSLRNKIFDFISCSGDKIENILSVNSGPKKDPRDKTQLQMLQSLPSDQFSVILLSIGGNNVKFSKIAYHCLLKGTNSGKNRCQDLLDYAALRLSSGDTPERRDLQTQLENAYRALINQPDAEDATVIVTGYARFFNDDDQSADDDNCDKKTLSLWGRIPATNDYTPYLNLQLRRVVNQAVLGLNQVIQDAISVVNTEAKVGKARRIRYIDMDQHFAGYRFCDKDPQTGRIRDFSESYMFLPMKRDITWDPSSGTAIPGRDVDGGPLVTRYPVDTDCDNDDTESEWLCATRGLTADKVDKENYLELFQDFGDRLKNKALGRLTKAFHPKSVVYTKVFQDIQRRWGEWQRDSECPCEP